MLGLILPTVFGINYAHEHICHLLNKIRANGYHIIYISSRACGQVNYFKINKIISKAGMTRDFM